MVRSMELSFEKWNQCFSLWQEVDQYEYDYSFRKWIEQKFGLQYHTSNRYRIINEKKYLMFLLSIS